MATLHQTKVEVVDSSLSTGLPYNIPSGKFFLGSLTLSSVSTSVYADGYIVFQGSGPSLSFSDVIFGAGTALTVAGGSATLNGNLYILEVQNDGYN